MLTNENNPCMNLSVSLSAERIPKKSKIIPGVVTFSCRKYISVFVRMHPPNKKNIITSPIKNPAMYFRVSGNIIPTPINIK